MPEDSNTKRISGKLVEDQLQRDPADTTLLVPMLIDDQYTTSTA
jgi:hypothetical protein